MRTTLFIIYACGLNASSMLVDLRSSFRFLSPVTPVMGASGEFFFLLSPYYKFNINAGVLLGVYVL